MAVQTISAWKESTVNGFYFASCTALTDANNEIKYTNKTPSGLDNSKL